jgi:hypothetical protein
MPASTDPAPAFSPRYGGGRSLPPVLLTMEVLVVTRVHARSRATYFPLQSGSILVAGMRRETSRVLFLMCPFCVRALLLDVTTTRFAGVVSVGDRGETGSGARQSREVEGAHTALFTAWSTSWIVSLRSSSCGGRAPKVFTACSDL